MNNNNIVFIFGTHETDLALTPDIPRLLKLACYVPLDGIVDRCQPRVIRYLMDEEWILRCWGCHRLLTEFAYPHNFCDPSKSCQPIIILCCSHSCPEFVKFYKTSMTCMECNTEFIPSVTKLDGQQNGDKVCPNCWFARWTQDLSARLSLVISTYHNQLNTNNIIRFAILNKCRRINK
jgi:hypothetical protein